MKEKHISTADTAKIIRQELSAAFPGIKFSVRSKVYSGGSSIRVEYTDGPKSSEVDKVVQQFSGAWFDGMEDLKHYKKATMYKGELVSWGVDYIFVDRNSSVGTFTAFCQAIAQRYGCPAPIIALSQAGGSPYVTNEYDERYMRGSIHSEFHNEFGQWDEKDGRINSVEDLPSVKAYNQREAAYEAELAAGFFANVAAEVVEVEETRPEVKPVVEEKTAVRSTRKVDWRVW